MGIRPHKRLDIWEEIMKLIEETYRVTSRFPKEEIYGITSQIRRSSISIASNLAEGFARGGDQEKVRFLSISRGSLSELDAQLEISLRLGFTKQEEYNKLNDRLEHISRMLQGLINNYKNEKT
jgi:four helix bundle protein